MTKEEKILLKDKIDSEIPTLERTIEALKEGAGPVAPDNSIGRLTRMEAINSAAVSGASLSRAKFRLAGLRTALARIDETDFGLCAECGEPIPVKRIMILPESTLCIGCIDEGRKTV